MTIMITRGKIHTRVNALWVFAQSTFNKAHRLDEISPVRSPQYPQAADTVTDRHLSGRLLLILDLDHLFSRHANFGEPLLNPG